jgi:hypothetical protein
MSVGDLKTYGGKGTDWPWQYKMLLGLDKILAAFSSGTTSYLAPQNRTTVLQRSTNSLGNIPNDIYSFSFANVGTVDVLLDTITIKPGETVSFDAGALNNKLVNVMPYDCTGGGEVLITIIQ